jgi:hypothetical protein
MRTSRACYSMVFSQLWTRYVATRRGRKCGDHSKEQPAKWRGTILCHLVASTESKLIRNQVLGTWQMNEQITALWYSPDEATYAQAAFAILRCEWINEWMNESACCQRNFDRACQVLGIECRVVPSRNITLKGPISRFKMGPKTCKIRIASSFLYVYVISMVCWVRGIWGSVRRV